MSRVANNPIDLPDGVDASVANGVITVKGSKGEAVLTLNSVVEIDQQEEVLRVSAKSHSRAAKAMAGTTRALVNNMVLGVSVGWQRKLELQGVGYRAQSKGRILNLQLGFSHPIDFELPEGVDVATPTQTEIVVSGVDKQLVGQVSAEIRSFRPPEPYKGKGVRYADERVRRKEAKKK
jgi:large subunit ribosomal protein L6